VLESELHLSDAATGSVLAVVYLYKALGGGWAPPPHDDPGQQALHAPGTAS